MGAGHRCLVEGISDLGGLLLRINALLLPPILIFCRGIRLHFRALHQIIGPRPLTLLIIGRVEEVAGPTFRIAQILQFLHIQNFPQVIDRHFVFTGATAICLAVRRVVGEYVVGLATELSSEEILQFDCGL